MFEEVLNLSQINIDTYSITINKFDQYERTFYMTCRSSQTKNFSPNLTPSILIRLIDNYGRIRYFLRKWLSKYWIYICICVIFNKIGSSRRTFSDCGFKNWPRNSSEPVIGESIIFLEFIKNDTFRLLEFHLCRKEIQQYVDY